jgi:hypothetical protein
MGFMERLAEERIRTASEEGLFRNLPGHGKPLNLDDDSGIPEDMRLVFKILKNAGCLPAEMELRKEIYSLGQLIHAAVDEDSRKGLLRELNLLQLKEAIVRRK